MPVRSGDVLAGKYRVERVLGEGGMGVVVAARHLHLDQMVALKFLLPEAVANREALSRFVREARNAVRLRSEHVARIIDVGMLDGGAPYILMEFLEGSDLAGVLAQQGPLPVPVAVDFVLQACDAIAEAHALGIIHRDLKPQNLFVTRRHDNTSLVKVLDFGISKSLDGDDFTATKTQAVMGTPAYMSPEQMRSAKLVDGRTDVWALGIILYELVVGKVPWDAEMFTDLCFKVAMDPLPPLPIGLQQGGFEEVVRRCLEKDPARRFPDVHALASALQPLAPAHARPLVECIGRVLRGPTGEHAVGPASAVPELGTLHEATGQRVMQVGKEALARRLARLTATAVLVGIVAAAIVLGGGPRDGTADEPRTAPGLGRGAAWPARVPHAQPAIALPPSASSPVGDAAPSIGRESIPETVPPAKAKQMAKLKQTAKVRQTAKGRPPAKRTPALAPATATRPRSKKSPRPPSPPSSQVPADKPAAGADPLSSPD